MAEDLFTAARVESVRKKEYKMKVLKNETKRAFIDEYYRTNGEFTEELKKKAIEYKLVKRGINFETYPDLKEEIGLKDVISIFVEIKKASEKDFLRFYESYERKLEKDYINEEEGKQIISNSYRDLKTAYHTYRKCNTHGWNCPDEYITENEMKNLYLVLTKSKNENSGNTSHETNGDGEER